MNRKVRFRELTGWRPKNNEERKKNDEEQWRTVENLHEITHGNVSEALWKRFGLNFLNRNNFSHKFQVNPRYQEGWTNLLCPLSPIYRGKEGGGCRPARLGELGCFHQKAPPFVGTPWKVQVGLIAICTPLFTKYTLICLFFADFFSVTLRNFTNYVTILVFFP